jgi:hypothetical protein
VVDVVVDPPCAVVVVDAPDPLDFARVLTAELGVVTELDPPMPALVVLGVTGGADELGVVVVVVVAAEGV